MKKKDDCFSAMENNESVFVFSCCVCVLALFFSPMVALCKGVFLLAARHVYGILYDTVQAFFASYSRASYGRGGSGGNGLLRVITRLQNAPTAHTHTVV